MDQRIPAPLSSEVLKVKETGKIDFKKELGDLYRPKKGIITEIDVPQMNFLLIDGEGAPGSVAFGEAIEALFSVSYTLKFMVKKGPLETDYGVLPLEGLWWADDMENFSVDNKEDWKWTLMIMQPDLVSPDLVSSAVDQVKAKKNPAALPLLRFESYAEGRAVQTLHVGPFSEEGPVVQALHSYISENGYSMGGKHHEIYLSDFRRAAPEKLRTIIRQPLES